MFSIAVALMFYACVPMVGARWTISYVVDDAQATVALGPDRVPPMHQALNRAKAKLERILTGSTGSALITVSWTDPANPLGAADSQPSHVYGVSPTVARDKLINKSSADNEPASEIMMYERLPTGSVPFFYQESTQLTVNLVAVPNSLNKHLDFHQVADQNDGTIRFHPPNALLKWQFYEPTPTTPNLDGHNVFEAVVIHESMHLLGFTSVAEVETVPNALYTWDLFRFGDASIPISPDSFTTLARELGPSQEATAITALGSTTQAYKVSRGTRSGGDGKQAQHWRAYSRLDPPDAIGIMDPTSSGLLLGNLSRKYYTRADVEALDVMGWNVDPNAVPYANAGSIDPLAPLAAAQIAEETPITFSWGGSDFLTFSVYIYPGNEIVNDDPVRVFYQMPSGTTSATLEVADALPSGTYTWTVIGGTYAGNQQSESRTFTIAGGCDPIDFNQDGLFPDTLDVADFLSAFSGGACSNDPICNDIDFNNDGLFPDTLDIASFLSVFSGGPCL